MAGTRNSTTQAVRKAVRLLNCFTAGTVASLGVAELSALTGWTQSTVSRLLSALEDGGLVQRDPTTGRYTLGLQLVALAGAALAAGALHPVSYPHLVRLAAASGETANLCVLDAGQVLTIAEALGTHPIKLSGWVGVRLPLHATAAGKVILAALPEQRRTALLAADLPALTPRTVTDQRRLLDEIERVRGAGYALSVEELTTGLSSIAAPVRDHTGTVVAAMTAAGPSVRLTGAHLDRCIALVKQEAEATSRELGSRVSAA
jgi:DNA-binding IclR family transcriptional regulator